MRIRGIQSITQDRCAPGFDVLLSNFDPPELEASSCTAFGMWADMRLGYVNPGWERFAAENGAAADFGKRWGLGANVLAATTGPLESFFEEHYGRCLAGGEPWGHAYECSSARRFRWYHMQVYPLREREGLLVVNSLVAEGAHDPRDRAPTAPALERFTGASGMLVQCTHCRRFRRGNETVWDWVPAWVESCPDNTSRSLCPPCFRFHYPGADHDFSDV